MFPTMSSAQCCSRWLVMVFLCFQQLLTTTSGNVKFTFEFVDKDKDILKLTCHGDCSTDKQTVSSISIYNSTSQKVYGVARSAKSPNLPESSFGELTFYVAGGVNPLEKTCHLDLLLVKCGSLRHLKFGCNITTSDEEAVVHFQQAFLIIERQDPAGEPYILSNTNFIIVVVVFGVVVLLAVLFLALWLRGWCRYRRTTPVYRSASQTNHYQHQFYNADNPAMFDLPKSPSRISVDKSYDFRYPSSNGLVRKGSSRGDNYVLAHRMGQLPLPPVPPSPNSKRSFRHNQSTLKLTYAQPIDAIERDLSQDGDVTSPSQEQNISYSRQNSKRNTDVTSRSSDSQATYSHQSSRLSDDVISSGCDNPKVYSRQNSKQSADIYSSIPAKTADV